MNIKTEQMLFTLSEYHKLKDEQIARIEYRDHMVHVHLALIGATAGWALTHESAATFLIIPWVSVILGWAYIINDDRISALGEYIRNNLANTVESSGSNAMRAFAWEVLHRSDQRRTERKALQLLVDVIQFVGSGFTAIVICCVSMDNISASITLFIMIEFLLLLGLGFLLFRYTDLTSQ